MNNQVAQQRYRADQQQSERKPVGTGLNSIGGSAFVDGSLTVESGQSQRSVAFTSRVPMIWSYQDSIYACTSEIASADSSSLQSTGTWSSPCCVDALVGNDGERKSSCEFDSAQPSDFDGSEWVMNRNTFSGENYFWSNNEQPQDGTESSCVHGAYGSICESIGNEESVSSQASDQNQNCEVNPGSSGAINVSLGHVHHFTPDNFESLIYSLAKKGSQ